MKPLFLASIAIINQAKNMAMLRSTSLSLLLGLVLSLALLAMLSPSDTGQRSQADVLEFPGSDLLARGGKATRDGSTLRIRLDERGIAAVALPIEGLSMHRYRFLKLELREPPPSLDVTLFWTNAATADQAESHIFETRPRQVLWVATDELPGWEGEPNSVGLMLTGEPASEVQIEGVALASGSLFVQLQVLFNDWSGFQPWQRDSMNNYDGVTKLSQFYPTTVVAMILALSLIAYALLVVLRHRRLALDWRVVGAIGLVCWLALDLPWQYKLLRQLDETRQQFAGKSDAQKLAEGPDAAIYRSVTEALAQIPEDRARVFIASSDSYIGLRTAYYFYPHNVFRKFHGRELPYDQYLRPGDYIFVAYPSSLEIYPERGTLIMKRNRYYIDVLTESESGALLRLRST
ncbi:MAG: hypothetical protein Hals2KO_18610 [Halioglobus sp.]